MSRLFGRSLGHKLDHLLGQHGELPPQGTTPMAASTMTQNSLLRNMGILSLLWPCCLGHLT
jgi:hypothetical protein